MGLVLNGRLTVANLGDSIATLIHENGDLTKMNTIHEPTRPDEKSRIEAANGFVIKNRVNGELSVSRAFGDFEMKELIISDPECQTIQLKPEHHFLVLASDGIHRSYTQEHIVKRVLELRRQTESLKMIAQTIVEECLRLEGVSKPSNDNVTLIIISLADYLMDYQQRSLVNTP